MISPLGVNGEVIGVPLTSPFAQESVKAPLVRVGNVTADPWATTIEVISGLARLFVPPLGSMITIEEVEAAGITEKAKVTCGAAKYGAAPA